MSQPEATAPPSKIERLIRTITLIQSGEPWTAAGLAESFGVAERTVFRDLAVLRDAGFDPDFDRKDNRYRFREGAFMAPVQLQPDEALALAALCSSIAGDGQIAFLEPAERALAKITATLPEEVREDVAEIRDRIVMRTSPAASGEGYEDVYETMRLAVAKRLGVVCRYEAAHGRGPEDEDFDFEPYTLFFSVRAWYVVGWRSDRDALRTLKLSRFSKAAITARPFEIPADFSLDEHLGNAWGMIRGENEHKIVLRFSSPFAATVAETKWHRTQEVEEHPDGTVTFRCTVDGLDEIVWWVLGMGSSCTVVEPAELRARVVAEARAIVDAAGD